MSNVLYELEIDGIVPLGVAYTVLMAAFHWVVLRAPSTANAAANPAL